ncbi:hypothetical protein E0485_16935 [Paenibacillus albiflavus]|uniref:Uncharacterized protein n=1 Tax=Paenibacillus albiflavus TaxID=2545760 RepID=A0A4R4E775_9BACL|nr:hypothetical protein E0485_16935 [Paenibacillus albiflavus]
MKEKSNRSAEYSELVLVKVQPYVIDEWHSGAHRRMKVDRLPYEVVGQIGWNRGLYYQSRPYVCWSGIETGFFVSSKACQA